MKVLIVSNMYPSKNFPDYGTFVRNFCSQLEEINVEYSLSVMHKQIGKFFKILSYVKFYIFTFFKCVLGKYDIIYVHYPSYSALPIIAASHFKKIHLYVNVHGSDVLPLKYIQKKLERYTRISIALADKVIVPSIYFKEIIVNKYKFCSKNIVVYPSGGINKALFYQYKKNEIDNIKKRLGIDNSKYIIGFISRICSAKGWEIFLNAAVIIEKRMQNLIFLIIGSGEDDEKLDKKIIELNLKTTVYRLPSQSQEKLADFYNILDVFTFPTISSSESLGLVAIEAMACGVPVFASDYAAPHFYIHDGKNGYKYPVGDYQTMANLIIDYLNKPIEVQELIKNGALVTAEEYSESNIKSILESIF